MGKEEVLPWMFHKTANTIFGWLKASPYPVGCACPQWCSQWKGEEHGGSWFPFLPGFRGFLLNCIQWLHFTAPIWTKLLWANPFQLCRDIITLTFPKRTVLIPEATHTSCSPKAFVPSMSAELLLPSTGSPAPFQSCTSSARTTFLKHLILKTGSEFLTWLPT